ncbi:MAG: hypothetical protein ABIB71_08745 [Candidatus Woesearchaeota archaeon]
MKELEKIRRFWSRLKYWQKGGVIGLLIGSIPIIYSILPYKLFLGTIWPDLDLTDFAFKAYLLSYLLVGLVMGTVFGLIIDKISKKYIQFPKLSNAKKFGIFGFSVLMVFLLLINISVVCFLVSASISSQYSTILESLTLLFTWLFLFNFFLFPFVLIVSLISLTFGWVLDVLKKHKVLNWASWIIYVFMGLFFLFIVYSALRVISIIILVGLIGG